MATLAILATFAIASPAVAQDLRAQNLRGQNLRDQDPFTGKTIRLSIGTGPGGGYDTYGRLVARHIGRHIPGHPAVVPQNMPGASSLTLTNFLFNTAPRDGTAIGMINQAMPTEQYLDRSDERRVGKEC